MSALLNDPVAPPPQSIMHAVARHRDALQDYVRDFQRARVSRVSTWIAQTLSSQILVTRSVCSQP